MVKDVFAHRFEHDNTDRKIVEVLNTRERAYNAHDLPWAGYYTAVLDELYAKKPTGIKPQ